MRQKAIRLGAAKLDINGRPAERAANGSWLRDQLNGVALRPPFGRCWAVGGVLGRGAGGWREQKKKAGAAPWAGGREQKKWHRKSRIKVPKGQRKLKNDTERAK